MAKKSNEIKKAFRIKLIEMDTTQRDLAKKLGIRPSAITMAIIRGSAYGKVHRWFLENLNIDLKDVRKTA